MLPTTAMVLAAGKGTRLKPLTDVLPKPLVEVAGVPLVRLALRQLHAAGVVRAVLNLHHLGDAIRAHLGPHAEGVDLRYAPEPVILGTGGGIRAALPLLGDGPFYVVNADALQDVDLAALARTHAESGALATLCLREDPQAERFGAIGVEPSGRIGRMIDRFDNGRSTRQLMFTGVHLMDARVVAHLPLGEERCVVRQGYVPALERGEHLHAYVHPGAFHDVGTPERWAVAQAAVLSGVEGALLRVACAADPPLAAVAPGVWVSPRARIHAAARLVAPCVVQAGAEVGQGAVVGPGAALGRDVVVEAGARVERAALLAGAVVAAGTAVREQVQGPAGGLHWAWPGAPELPVR